MRFSIEYRRSFSESSAPEPVPAVRSTQTPFSEAE